MSPGFTHSLVVIAPADLWPTVQAVYAALGYDAGEGVALSADGSEPATHRGLHTWETSEFVNTATGQTPIEVPGYTAEQIAAFMAALTASVDYDGLTSREHFDHVASSMNLMLVEQAA